MGTYAGRLSIKAEPRAKSPLPTPTSAPALPVVGRDGQVRQADLLGLQRSIGNRAVVQLLGTQGVVQRAPEPAAAAGKDADEGGAATVNDAERDARDTLRDWQTAAHLGVNQFVTNALSSRLDNIESGSWYTFIKSLVGNTAWAAAAFTPVGMAATAFALSMAGIVVATPTEPKKSRSKIPEVARQGVFYINDVYRQLDGQLHEKATVYLGANPKTTRWRAAAEFVEASFVKGTYTIDPDNKTKPSLDQNAIIDQFVRKATERLEIAETVGRVTNLGGGGATEVGVTEDRTSITEVAWIRGHHGKPRLALIESEDTDHRLKRWVSADLADAAIAQWTSLQGQAPQVYAAEDVKDLRD